MNIEEEIKKQYDEGVAKVHRVYDIFKDFYGEERVDLQGIKSLDDFKTKLNNTPLKDYLSTREIGYLSTGTSEDKLLHLTNKDQSRILDMVNLPVRVWGGRTEYNPYILVWFPSIRVTNEYDKYTDIKDLYAKVPIAYDGSLINKFALNRATYTLLHIASGYMHSHVSNIPTGGFSYFQNPCTGSGPINDTMGSLVSGFDEDLWNLFCLELAKYVTVESIAGVPYHKLEDLGASNMRRIDSTHYEIKSILPTNWQSLHSRNGTLATPGLFKEFMLYAIASNKITYGHSEGSYRIGMPYFKFAVTLSNLFIEWYNKKYNEFAKSEHPLPSLEDLRRAETIISCKVVNNKFYSDFDIRGLDRYRRYIGNYMCTFKGRDVKINISDLDEAPKDYSNILNPSLIGFFAWRLIETINFEYGNKDSNNASGQITKGRRYL